MGKAKTGSKASMPGQGKLGAFFSQKPKSQENVAPPAANADSPAAEKPPPPVAATSTAAPEPATQAAPAAPEPTTQATPAAQSAPAAPATKSQPAAAAGPAGLTEEQRKRIEENRRKALERQQQKRALEKPREDGPAEKKAKEEAPAQKAQEEAPAQKAQEEEKQADKKVEGEAAAQKAKEEASASTQGQEMPAPKAKAAGKAKAKAAGKAAAKAAALFAGKAQQKPSDQGEESAAVGNNKRARSAPKAKADTAKPASGEPEGDEGGDITSPAKKSIGNRDCPDKDTPEKDPLPPELGRASPIAASTGSITARRQGLSVEPCAAKFQTFGTVPWMQYHSYYAVRLQKLRASVQAKAKSLWSSEVPPQNFLQSILGYKGVAGDMVLVGILHKEMSARPNIIEIYSKSKVVGSLPEEIEDAKPNFASEDDTLWLEDDSLRVNLQVSSDEIAKLATGLVAGVRGVATNDGKVRVVSICLPSTLVPPPLPSPASKDSVNGPFLALVSGLRFGAPGVDTEARDRAIQFLLGRCEQGHGQHLSTKIDHVVVCGGVYGSDEGKRVSPAGIAEADSFFTKLASEVPVDLLPGNDDPTNKSMPQMPLHPYFFRTARKCCHFRSLSSPYECSLGGLRVLGHGGQPVDDLVRCTRLQSPLEALKMSLQASHLAPTAPDTLATQPFNKVDPFVIETAPHILFSGGHERVEHEWNAGTLCVCVPSFQKTPAIVLVNLQNPREVHIQEFGGKPGALGAAEAGA